MAARCVTQMGTPRDRVIIDLRGIGDAVRSTASRRNITVAHLARQALVAAVGANEPTVAPGSDSPTPCFSTAKVTLRMPQPYVDALIVNAVGLGLSYGEYVARLISSRPLPRPSAERGADRAALRASNDHLAVLSADLNAFMRLLRSGDSAGVEKYRQRIQTVDTDIRHHLNLASKFMVDP